MKKLLLILLCVTLIFSCGNEKKKSSYNFLSIDLIKEPCDCVDYITQVFRIGISKMKNNYDYNAAKDKKLENQANKIEEFCKKKFRTDSMYINCDNFYTSKKIYLEFERLSSERKK